LPLTPSAEAELTEEVAQHLEDLHRELVSGGADDEDAYRQTLSELGGIYALRAGVDFPLGKVHLDVNANYRFLNTKTLQSVSESDLDSVTFGAIVRFDL